MSFSRRRQSFSLFVILAQSKPRGWPAHNLPLKFNSLRRFFANEWFFFCFASERATEAIADNLVTLWGFFISLWIQIFMFSNAVLPEYILAKFLNSRTQPNIVVLTSLRPRHFFFKFLFLLCISSFSFLILHCYCSAERVWNIYQGIVCRRHNFYMVMLLASQITLCSGEQNNPSLGTLFFFF